MSGQADRRAIHHCLRTFSETALSCEPADRELAEEGACLAYEAAKHRGLQRIIWCGSPFAIAKQIAAASASSQIGRGLKTSMVEDVIKDAFTVPEITWGDAFRLTPPAGDRQKNATLHSLSELSAEEADLELFRPSVRLRHFVTRLLGAPSILPRESFREIAAGPDELAKAGIYRHLRDEHGRRVGGKGLAGLWKIARGSSWFAPFEKVCWFSERPVHVLTDSRGRLHSADGPAIRYPDGAKIHVWKGVSVPAWMIERPERITSGEIDAVIDPVLRNTMIDIMTPERFIASGGALRVSSDKTGILWRRHWTYRGVTIGTWSAVEVVNGIPAQGRVRKRYILVVPAHVKTAREAVVWSCTKANAGFDTSA